MKLFLVEDSAFLRERLTHMVSLIPKMNVVGYAASPPEAIEKIRATKPDVVLLDIHLQQGTGYQVLEQIKQVPEPAVVIVLTNYAYLPYREKYMQGGADYFFDKSTEFEQMLQILWQLHDRVDPQAKKSTRTRRTELH